MPLLLLGLAVTAALLLTALVPDVAQGTGAGPDFADPHDIAVEASGDLVVADPGLVAVLRVDPVTGDRTIVSDAGTGAGPAFANPFGVAVEASGDLVVVDNALDAVLRADPVTGDRTVVSDAGTGTGPKFVFASGIAVEASGDLVVVDIDLRAVLRIDPVTGYRVSLSAIPKPSTNTPVPPTDTPVPPPAPVGGVAFDPDARELPLYVHHDQGVGLGVLLLVAALTGFVALGTAWYVRKQLS